MMETHGLLKHEEQTNINMLLSVTNSLISEEFVPQIALIRVGGLSPLFQNILVFDHCILEKTQNSKIILLQTLLV